MDVNIRKVISLVPNGSHLCETVIHNRIRHFDDTFKYEGVYWLETLHKHTLTCQLFGNEKAFHVALPKVICLDQK